MNTMKKLLFNQSVTVSNSPSQTNLNTTINLTDSNSETFTNKSIKDIYSKCKLYHDYLGAINSKINKGASLNIDEVNLKDFDECYRNADIIYEKIKNEWFWLSNGDEMKQFKYLTSSDSMENHKQEFFENFQMLEASAKIYGFDLWYSKLKE